MFPVFFAWVDVVRIHARGVHSIMPSGPRRKARAAKSRAPGQATVELALILPLLLLLLVGVADVARIFAGHLQVVQAAGVGARWATLTANQKACGALPSPTPSTVEYITLASINGAVRNATVVILPTPVTDPRTVRVQIT